MGFHAAEALCGLELPIWKQLNNFYNIAMELNIRRLGKICFEPIFALRPINTKVLAKQNPNIPKF